MANYCSMFIQDFSMISAPLRELTKKGTPWQWGDTHKQALQQLKDALASATTMFYFDPSKDTELIFDASPVSLGAILSQMQNGQKCIIAYASRALSGVEK